MLPTIDVFDEDRDGKVTACMPMPTWNLRQARIRSQGGFEAAKRADMRETAQQHALAARHAPVSFFGPARLRRSPR